MTKTRLLTESLQKENSHLLERLEVEKKISATLLELNETRKSETEAVRAAVTAKNETIAAKDAVIIGQEKLIGALKNKGPSPWRRIGDVLIGAAVFAILK